MESVLFEWMFEGQHLEVIEKDGQRSLQSNRMVVHSRIDLNNHEKLISPYQKQMMLGITFPSKIKKVLHLGLGGGCMLSFIHKYMPEVHQLATEKCVEVMEVAKRFFFLPESKRVRVILNDSRNLEFLKGESFDLIFLDLCDFEGPIADAFIFSYLKSLKEILSSGAWLIANTWKKEKALQGQLLEWKRLFTTVFYTELPEESSVIYASLEGEFCMPESFKESVSKAEKSIPLEFSALLDNVLLSP
jgi:spermidine synthase